MTGVEIIVDAQPGPLAPPLREEVAALVAAATESDGVPPLSEQVLLRLRAGDQSPARDVLSRDAEGTLTGFAHLDLTNPVEAASGELVVHPAHRRQGYGHALVEALLAAVPGRPVRLWAHGNHPGAARLAAAHGFTGVRELWRMRRPLDAPLAEPVLPAGVRVRAFRPGADDEAWLALNAAAFADHPEQGQWTMGDLQLREAEKWFDPAGFFLAARDEPSGERLLGFHWTKVHGPGGDHPDEPIGEVYVVGVHPRARGLGLGKALTLVGLGHLRSVGLAQAMLYVDAGNTAAVAMYTALGFAHADTDVMYGHG